MKISFVTKDGMLVARLSGELDHHSAAAVKEEIENEINVRKLLNLCFDLSELEFMDSSGVGVIVGRYKTLRAIGGKTYIAAPTPQISRLLDLCGLPKIIPVYENTDTIAI